MNVVNNDGGDDDGGDNDDDDGDDNEDDDRDDDNGDDNDDGEHDKVDNNPYAADATFVQRTRMQRFLKTFETWSCWYSLDSSRWVLSDEYPFARVTVNFLVFCIILYLPN